ncbi:MAG: DNA translocase FtsK 4TM domain-containing protein, partial [Panacagrimonas sp.]
MSKSKSQATVEPGDPGWLERLPREAGLLACIGLSLFLLSALISFDANDPGWTSSGTGAPVQNLMGPVGAWSADVLLSLFGYVAFLLPWGVCVIGVRLYRAVSIITPVPALARAAAWIVMLASLSALCALHAGVWPSFPPQGGGGIAGQIIGSWFVQALKPLGASLSLLTLFLAAAPLALMFSWIAVIDRVGEAMLRCIPKRRPKVEDADPLLDLINDEPEVRAKPARRESIKRKTPDLGQLLDTDEGETAVDAKLRLGAATPDLDLVSEERAAKPRPLRKPRVDALMGTVFDGDPLPPVSLLDPARQSGKRYTNEELERLSRDVERHLADFGIKTQVVAATPGPVITRFELQPAPGVKGAQITNLSNDLARSLSVSRVRVIEVIEGKPFVGLEIPNTKREMVALREILESPAYKNATSPLSMALGKDIAGNPVSVDLARMPHLLVAGTTGAGKSVAINVMILSMLYKATREQVRF